MTRSRSRAFLAGAAVIPLTALAVGCGGSGDGNATKASPPPAAQPAPKASPAPQDPGVPQNNGGDGDADNNGGPDDGDGGV